MTCTGPTAGKGPAPLRQPPGVILNGRRTASPSATWRTIRAPASSACRTTGRDQDVVMKASRAEVSDSATPDVRSRAATSWGAGLSQQSLRRRDHLAPVIQHRPRPRAVRHHQPLNPHPVPPTDRMRKTVDQPTDNASYNGSTGSGKETAKRSRHAPENLFTTGASRQEINFVDASRPL